MARRPLPPLNALRAFEAFGRHGRMTAAADELFVTHGAVSRQVRSLEEQLGVRLTEGPKSRLRLTEQGLRLAQSLTQAFDLIRQALPPPPAREDRVLGVSCQPTFAMKWLIPRLPGFIAANPDVPVRIAESNGPFDFQADDIDIAIRMRSTGDVSSPDAEVVAFLEHFVGPVMAPDLAQEGMTIEALGRLPRLHTKTFRESWADWEAQMGVVLPPAPANLEFDHYFYMLEAAAAGLGVASGPWAFVQRDLAGGRLVAPFGLIPGRAQIVALTPKSGATPQARRFRQWLIEEGAATPAPPSAV